MGVPEEGLDIFAAEVRRRGGTAERLPGRQSIVLVQDPTGRQHRVRLKTKKTGDWQDMKSSRFVRPPDNPIHAWALVDVTRGVDQIKIVESEWMRRDIGGQVDRWLSQDSTRDAKANNHHRISEANVAEWKGRWDLIGLADEAMPPESRVDETALGAWVFKCNPKTWDLQSYLADGNTHIADWSVANNYRAEMIRHGQKALFWVSGPEEGSFPRGIWGFGWTLSERSFVARADDTYWLDADKRIDTNWFVDTDLHLLERPLASSDLRHVDGLEDLEVIRQPQGSNPSWVSHEQFAAIEALLPTWPTLGETPGQRLTVSESGAGFGDPVTNKLIENAAVDAVSNYYQDEFHCTVEDVGSQKLGWDLTCTEPDGIVYRVEVKGVAGRKPSVLLTRNELRSAREDDNWELAVVTSALAAPKISIYYPDDVLAVADAFVYRVDLPDD